MCQKSNKCFKLSLTRTYERDKVKMKEVVKMKKLFLKYGGVIFFYTTIVVMILAINYRFSYLEKTNTNFASVERVED